MAERNGYSGQQMKKVYSIDCGLDGALALFDDNQKFVTTLKMPVETIVTKEPYYILDKKNGKKQFYKSGLKKGEAKYKIKTPGKTKKIIDVQRLIALFAPLKEHDTIVIEHQAPRQGNSAQSSFTTGVNYGRVLAAATTSRAKMIIVTPAQWKTDMHISITKEEKIVIGDIKAQKEVLKAKSCSLATHLTGESFKTVRGALRHDEAEATIIGFWHINKNMENTNA